MALSSSESALLTETCTNMNVAANTCREVLEMLRSLGNTGVVDIATHNNATTAHANASNLAQQDAAHGIHYGDQLTDDNYPIELVTSSGSALATLRCETKGLLNKSPKIYARNALTDSGNNLIEFSDAPQTLGGGYFYAFSINSVIEGLEGGSSASMSSGLQFFLGSASHPGNFKYSTLRVQLTNGTTTATVCDFTTEKITPFTTNAVDLGDSTHAWKTAYFGTSPVVVSDSREKSEISDIGAEAVDFVMGLRPVKYRVNVGTQKVVAADEYGEATQLETTPGSRRHWGFIAQEVKEAMSQAGIEDAAVWSLADKDDPDSRQALRYEELIAPMIKVIQQQQERIEALERKAA